MLGLLGGAVLREVTSERVPVSLLAPKKTPEPFLKRPVSLLGQKNTGHISRPPKTTDPKKHREAIDYPGLSCSCYLYLAEVLLVLSWPSGGFSHNFG